MLIEPVPTGPRSPVRRALRLAGLVAPVALLAGVVAVGVLGPRSEPAPGDDAAPSAVTALVAPPATGAPDGVTPDAGPTAVIDPAPETVPPVAPAFPTRLSGLEVHGVADTLAARRDGAVGDIVAVAGHITIRELGAECADRYLGPSGAVCPRTAVLADSPLRPYPPSTGGGAGFAAIGPHLHPTILAGVRLPRLVVGTLRGDRWPVPVVVLGRFTGPQPGPCIGGNRTCDEAFVVERVAWTTADESGDTIAGDRNQAPGS